MARCTGVSRKGSATRCSRKSFTTKMVEFSPPPLPTTCRRPHTRFHRSNCTTSKPRAPIRSPRRKVWAKAAASVRLQQWSMRSMMRSRLLAWRSTRYRQRRSAFALRCVPGSPLPRERAGRTWSSEMVAKTAITLTINGRDHPIAVEPRRTLADAIREDCGQTGTHIGCEHGICGACTVIVDGEPLRSCLMFAAQAAGKKIRTIEGLANGDKLHPMQQAFMDHHGLQCGFCTPGFLMLAVGVLEREPNISDDDLLDVLSSNLCRCTGYQNIIKAVRAAAKEMRKR